MAALTGHSRVIPEFRSTPIYFGCGHNRIAIHPMNDLLSQRVAALPYLRTPRPCIGLNGEQHPYVGSIDSGTLTLAVDVPLKPLDVFTFGDARFVVTNIFKWSREPFKRVEFQPVQT